MESSDPVSSYEILTYVLGLLLLLFLSALFSGSETALTSVGIHKLKEIISKEKEEKGEKNLLKNLLHQSNKLLTAILVANNAVNILATSLATILIARLIPESGTIVAALTTVMMTTLIVIFGEITPKIYARERTEPFFNRTIGLVKAVELIFRPIIWLLMKISRSIIRVLGGKGAEEFSVLSEEYIIETFDIGHEAGVIESQERKMLKGTLMMKDTAVKEIMTPRVEMVCIEDEKTLEEFIELVSDEGYSRIPVFHESVDHITGICYAKDVFDILVEEGTSALKDHKVKDIARDPLFVPETMKLDDLLKEFIQKRVHIAIVVDEFGGTAGLVTMEDVIEELTGDILDEYDELSEGPTLKRVNDSVFIVDASIPINDLERELDVEFPETEYETLAGYLLEQFERFPEVGEEIVVNGFKFKIVAATKNKIERVRMEIISEEGEQE
ncbi:MAG: magnesium and cobalt exporter, family [Thermotogota bacterium]|nr:magnesium and cobalt exporter, family [Thermotogota bacterium]MDK2864753.1 magnesium and cobalt exporter, family [Thermotogota bacterium]HCZ07487.1 HlyC/CorC family transporter [Thermotogota bacterium]